MDPKRQVTLAEDKSQISPVSDHFLELTLSLNVGNFIIGTAWQLEACGGVMCNIGPRDYGIVVLSNLKYDLVER